MRTKTASKRHNKYPARLRSACDYLSENFQQHGRGDGTLAVHVLLEMVCREAWEVYQRAEAAREEASLGKILRSVIFGY